MTEFSIRPAFAAREMSDLKVVQRAIFPAEQPFDDSVWTDPTIHSFWIYCGDDLNPAGLTVMQHNVEVAATYDMDSPASPGTLYILLTGLKERWRGMGIGTIVKAWQIAYARNNRFEVIVTNLRPGNTASQRFNIKMGFRVAETKSGFYNMTLPHEDSVVMRYAVPTLSRR